MDKRLKITSIILSIIIILSIGISIRTANIEALKGENLLALDPYLFLRYTENIVDQGSLPVNDTLRYHPLGFDPSKENLMVSQVCAVMYNILSPIFPSLTVQQTVIIYPVIFFTLGVIVFFFLVREWFDTKTGLIASLLLSVYPSYLYRTMAGFSDKEPLGLFLIFLTLYFITLASKMKHHYIFSALGGLTTAFLGLTWGGVRFVLLTVPLYYVLLFFIKEPHKRHLIDYSLWTTIIISVFAFTTKRYGGLAGVLKTTETMFPIAILGFLVLLYISHIYKDKLSFSIKGTKIDSRYTITGICIAAGTIILAVIPFIREKIFRGLDQIIHPIDTSRLMLTVAEARQPYFYEWIADYSWFFFIFIAGLLWYYSSTIKADKRFNIIFRGSIIYLLIGVFISRLSPNSIFDGLSGLSIFMLMSSILVFLIILLSLHVYNNKYNTLEKLLKEIKPTAILLTSWMFVMLISARGAVRLFMMLAPIVAIFSSWLLVKLYNTAMLKKDRIYKYTIMTFTIGLFIISVASNGVYSYTSATNTYPSFNSQWEYAMDYVSQKTSNNSVFAHWWDYGYWVQTKGERSTILDGGNYLGYWNHLMARNVLCAENSTDALEYLYSYNSTHLLVISDEIGKYTAYSSIGADENFDIFSWINVFRLSDYSTRSVSNNFTYLYLGASQLDHDLEFEGKTLPQKESVIAGFFIETTEDDIERTAKINSVTAAVYYEGEQTRIPVNCLYKDGKRIDFNTTGLNGCAMYVPVYYDNGYQQPYGSVMYISEKGMNTLWTRLFLFDEKVPGFDLVYDDSDSMPFYFYGSRVYGPLKIWEVKYPKGFEVDSDTISKYLATETPEWMNMSRTSAFEIQ